MSTRYISGLALQGLMPQNQRMTQSNSVFSDIHLLMKTLGISILISFSSLSLYYSLILSDWSMMMIIDSITVDLEHNSGVRLTNSIFCGLISQANDVSVRHVCLSRVQRVTSNDDSLPWILDLWHWRKFSQMNSVTQISQNIALTQH